MRYESGEQSRHRARDKRACYGYAAQSHIRCIADNFGKPLTDRAADDQDLEAIGHRQAQRYE